MASDTAGPEVGPTVPPVVRVCCCPGDTAGWDRDITGDPMFWRSTVEAALGLERGTSTCKDTMTYMIGQELQTSAMLLLLV